MKIFIRALAYYRSDAARIAFVLTLLLVSIGLNVLKPWPMALLVDNVLAHKPYPRWVPQDVTRWGQSAQLALLIGALLTLHLGHATISGIQQYVSIGIGLRGLRRVRNDVFAWLQRLSLRFHHGSEAGDIIFRAGTDTCAFQTVFQQGLLVCVTSLFTLILMIFVMFRLNWQLTLLGLATVPFLLISIKKFSREMRARGLAAQQSESKVYSLIHQGILAMPLIQSYTREQHEQERFKTETARAQKNKMSQHGLEVLYWFVISVILGLSTAAVTWFGARQVISGALTLGELLIFLAYLAQLFEPLNQLSQVGATLSSASASIRRVNEILDTPDEVTDRPGARSVRGGQKGASAPKRGRAGKTPSLEAHGNITYEDVSFGYQEGRPVLQGVSFQLDAGKSAAIIGPSGAGKTTLLNLLPRFFDPIQGAVLLEAVDLRELRVKDLRAQIALVLQEPIILPATVAENISYGRPDATMKQIENAARAANADEFINRLPMRYKTVVGDGGARLSVGERQRLNLARAFLKDAPILLMDEPTSALDVESESLVVSSLFQLMRGRTTLMVAHRLTTIKQVDKILVVEAGRVVETGTPSELVMREGYYSRVVNGQLELR
ncbi:MAG: ATP-binding cassette, subfamily bacterial [Verrucomicrobiota bacterium]|jgi:ATP-binding cassette subfamily B protein/subfamily B ATP-binding cassette protein MsbA